MVYLEHFDLGIFTLLEAKLVTVTDGGVARGEYAVTHPTVKGPSQYEGKIPVFFAGGNQNFMAKYFPCIVVSRTEAPDADDNRKVGWNLESVKPAPFSTTNTVTDQFGVVYEGRSAYRIKTRTFPYDLTYEVTATARGGTAKSDAQALWMYLLGRLTPDGFSVAIVDSEGNERTYDGTVDNPIIDTNYLDLTMREIKYGMTIKVKGEIDFAEPFDVKSVSERPTATVRRF